MSEDVPKLLRLKRRLIHRSIRMYFHEVGNEIAIYASIFDQIDDSVHSSHLFIHGTLEEPISFQAYKL